MSKVKVVHAETGRAWVVGGETGRPTHRRRVAAGVAGTGHRVGSLAPAACCGADVAVAAPGTTVLVNGRRVAVAAACADRVANDHPAFLVTDEAGRPARVGYSPATVVLACPTHNGSGERDLVRAEREAAALARLVAFGTPA